MFNFLERLGHIQFNTRISITENSIFDLKNFRVVKEINSTKNFFSLHPTVIVADPFLFTYFDELYLFYEEQIDLQGKGVIKMIKTSDLKQWSKPIIVLKEPFHLSYPNVFEFDNSVYMLPETGQTSSIKLYKANKDLSEWKFVQTLLTGKIFVDTSIINFNSMFYLFTTDYSDGVNVLELYYSNTIFGNWTKHPQSPIAIGNNKGRCAGSLFFFNNIIYRPTQCCEKLYGGGVDIYKVLKMNTKEYKEEKFMNIIPNDDYFYSIGGHHFKYCKYNGKNVIATDGIELCINFFEILRIIKRKICK